MTSTDTAQEQTRARYPDRTGYVERDGVRVFWEEYGHGEPTIFFLHGWPIAHSRVWKGQIPYFARHAHVITMDARGNGRSDRPLDSAAHAHAEHVGDLIAVLDATGTERALRRRLVARRGPGDPRGRAAPRARRRPLRARERRGADRRAAHPRRRPSARSTSRGTATRASRSSTATTGSGTITTSPSSSSACASRSRIPRSSWTTSSGWAMDTTPEALAATVPAIMESPLPAEAWMKVSCPMLVIAGADDAPDAAGDRRSRWPRQRTPSCSLSRASGTARPGVRRCGSTWRCATSPASDGRSAGLAQALHRPRRALFVSSPIGLGHAWRDVAIARELRALVPDLEIDWLAQEPVTRVLEAEGERIHPASAELASEAAHIDAEAHGHELDVFQAYRRMDEILLANFMLFHDVVEQEPYDLWIGDEAWEIDHFLHENPECKRAAYVWLTDFVGFLPLAEGDEREAFLTADYNAEMLEQIERYPRVRDRSIFIGTPDDIVPDRFGPDLPHIREWTEEHFAFTGYVPGHDGARSSRGPQRPARGVRLRRRRSHLHRDGRRLGRGRVPAAASHRGPRGRRGSRPRPADDHHRRPTDRNRARCLGSPAWRSSATSTT